MKIKVLRTTHPSYDSTRWCDLTALARGGKEFGDRILRFLPQNAVEPAQIYAQRTMQAHYTSYMGSIVNLYVSWLFAADFNVKPSKRDSDEPIEPDPFYGRFQEDIGNETTVKSFMRERFREALVRRCSHWLIELPSNGGVDPDDLAVWETRGLGRATLRELDNCQVLDWACDQDGAYEWVILHSKEHTRKSWAHARDTVVETWRIYDRENITVFDITYPENRKPSDDTEIEQVGPSLPHGFKRVPVVRIELPTEICIGEQTHDPQLEHFRLDNALSWLIRRTCYAQPVFKLDDGEKPPTMGAGYAILLGKDDEFGWTSPPVAPFDVLRKTIEAKRDEIYRVTQQMAQAVDNNAETVGRSADSKEIDAAATRIMLNAYGEYVSEAIEETYEIISEARGEKDYEWSVTGFSGYDTATVASLISNAKDARELGIPSIRFHKELCIKVASALFAGEDQRVKDSIRKEIEAAPFAVSSRPLEQELHETELAVQKDAADAAAEAVAQSSHPGKPTRAS